MRRTAKRSSRRRSKRSYRKRTSIRKYKKSTRRSKRRYKRRSTRKKRSSRIRHKMKGGVGVGATLATAGVAALGTGLYLRNKKKEINMNDFINLKNELSKRKGEDTKEKRLETVQEQEMVASDSLSRDDELREYAESIYDVYDKLQGVDIEKAIVEDGSGGYTIHNPVILQIYHRLKDENGVEPSLEILKVVVSSLQDSKMPQSNQQFQAKSHLLSRDDELREYAENIYDVYKKLQGVDIEKAIVDDGNGGVKSIRYPVIQDISDYLEDEIGEEPTLDFLKAEVSSLQDKEVPLSIKSTLSFGDWATVRRYIHNMDQSPGNLDDLLNRSSTDKP